jgi:hypothetical protein
MLTIDPQDLPYPWPDGVEPVSTEWGSRKDIRRQVDAFREGRFDEMDAVRFPGALAAGSAVVTVPRKPDVKGAHLAFYQDKIGIFWADGRRGVTAYDFLDWFRVRRGLMVHKLTLHGTDGVTMHFRIGSEMASNAKYILNAKGVRSK